MLLRLIKKAEANVQPNTILSIWPGFDPKALVQPWTNKKPRFNPKLNQNRDLNQNKIKTKKKNVKNIRFFNKNIKWRTINSIQTQTQQRKHQTRLDFNQQNARFCLQSSIDKKSSIHLLWLLLKHHDFYQNRFQFKTKTLRLKPIKTCYWCMKILDYLLKIIYKLVETKIKLKWNLKVTLKTMFFRWTWRTWTGVA
jgi:hypothetical protein